MNVGAETGFASVGAKTFALLEGRGRGRRPTKKGRLPPSPPNVETETAATVDNVNAEVASIDAV